MEVENFMHNLSVEIDVSFKSSCNFFPSFHTSMMFQLTRKHKEIERRLLEEDSAAKEGKTEIDNNNIVGDSATAGDTKRKVSKSESSESDLVDTPTSSNVVYATGGGTSHTLSSSEVVVSSESKQTVFTYLTSLSEGGSNSLSRISRGSTSSSQMPSNCEVSIDIEQSAANQMQVSDQEMRTNDKSRKSRKRIDNPESEFCETTNASISSPEESPIHSHKSTGGNEGAKKRSGSGSIEYGTFPDSSSSPNEFSTTSDRSSRSVRFGETREYLKYHGATVPSPTKSQSPSHRTNRKTNSKQRDEPEQQKRVVQHQFQRQVDYF